MSEWLPRRHCGPESLLVTDKLCQHRDSDETAETPDTADNHLEGLGMGWTRPECSFLHEFVLRKLHRRLGLRSLGWGRDQPWSPACIGWC